MSEMLWQYHNMQQNPASLVRQVLLGRPASQGKWLARWGQVLAPKHQKLATVKRDQKRPVPNCASKKNNLFNINTKKWPLLPFLATGQVKKAASASGSVFFLSRCSWQVLGAPGSWRFAKHPQLITVARLKTLIRPIPTENIRKHELGQHDSMLTFSCEAMTGLEKDRVQGTMQFAYIRH